MYAMQGYYGGYGAFDTTTAGSTAAIAYGYLQSTDPNDTPRALQAMNLLSAADKSSACQQMTATAASDADTTMKAKVASLCSQAGVSAGFLGLSTTTWIVLAVGGAGLIYLISKKKK